MKTPTRALSALLLLSAALTLAGCAREAESALDTTGEGTQSDPFVQAQGQAPVGQEVAAEPTAPTEPAVAQSAVAEPAVAHPAHAAPAPEPARASGPRPIRRADAGRTDASPRSEPAPAHAPRVPAFIAAGTSVTATVDEELTTQHARAGDRFHARLSDDVLGANGEVLLRAGTVLNGRVAAAHASTGPQDLAALQLEVESITADGRTLPLIAEIVELDMEASTRDSNTETAVKTAAGAAAGALIGRITGKDRESTVKGAVAGAVAGGAVAAATRQGHATVKPGARMVVRLTERLIVEP